MADARAVAPEAEKIPHLMDDSGGGKGTFDRSYRLPASPALTIIFARQNYARRLPVSRHGRRGEFSSAAKRT
jgi:hypothetical protein